MIEPTNEDGYAAVQRAALASILACWPGNYVAAVLYAFDLGEAYSVAPIDGPYGYESERDEPPAEGILVVWRDGIPVDVFLGKSPRRAALFAAVSGG